MKKYLKMAVLGAALSLLSAGSMLAQGYEFSGTAVYGGGEAGRGVTISSINTSHGSINFDIPDGLTLNELDTLSTMYMTEDGCTLGSPRFVVQTEEGGQYEFWWNCTAGTTFQNTGDLTDGNVDVAGRPGHPYQYQASFSSVQSQYGAETITAIFLVVDGSAGFSDATQVVSFDNTNVDGTVYTYETPGKAAQCKNGGWSLFLDAIGEPLYRNQGQCVASLASQGKSGGKK